MNIHKLKIFIDLTETLNYTETAERCFTTQGNVSKQMMALEKEMGGKLFERAHRAITLTNFGQLALPYAKEIVAKYHEMQQILDAQQAKEALSLTFLTIPTLSNYRGFALLTDFIKLHPEITSHFTEGEGNQLFPFLKEAPNHLIFARTFQKNDPAFDLFFVEEDCFVAVVPKDHPLASQKELRLRDLKTERFVAMEEDTLLYSPMEALCKEAGFTPNIVFQSARIDLLLNMVEQNLGVAILMEKSIDPTWKKRIEVIAMNPTKKSYLSFIRNQEQKNKASQIFWDYLTTVPPL